MPLEVWYSPVLELQRARGKVTPGFLWGWGGALWPLGWAKPHFKDPVGTQSRSQPWPSTFQPKCEMLVRQKTKYVKPSLHVTHQISPKPRHKQGPFCCFVPISETPIHCFTKEVRIWLLLKSLASLPIHTMLFMTVISILLCVNSVVTDLSLLSHH